MTVDKHRRSLSVHAGYTTPLPHSLTCKRRAEHRLPRKVMQVLTRTDLAAAGGGRRSVLAQLSWGTMQGCPPGQAEGGGRALGGVDDEALIDGA
jgi:hypothetical protein